MTQPHYTRTIDALWMHDTWKINFQYYSTAQERYYPLSCDRLRLMVKDSRTEPAYILPDSLDFFQPRDGDLWICGDDSYYYHPDDGFISAWNGEPLIPELHSQCRLLERNGISVIWPEGM